MKSPEELKSLKEEVETLNKKLSELTEDELKQVAGGWAGDWRTVMECRNGNCCYKTEWLGDYRGKGPYKCSSCYNDSLWGTDIYYQG